MELKTYVKRFVRAGVAAYRTRRLHAKEKARATAAYQAIVSHNPSHALNTSQRRSIRTYSTDVLGSSCFAPWLETYSAYRGGFLEGWIPWNYFVGILLPRWTRYHNIDSKIFTRRLLGTEGVPDIAYYFNGFWLDRDHAPIPTAELKERIFSKTDAVFVKQDRSLQGLGVWKVDKSEFDAEKLAKLGDLVVQLPIKQHPFFERFTPHSVATLRITTVKEAGRPAARKASYLRLARHGAPLVRSAASIRVSIVDSQGTLDERGADSTWKSLTAHPDSGTPFGGAIVPGYKRAVDFCQTLHDQNPFTVLIGWDIAIDPSEHPVLMEWNQGRADIIFSEASIGPCFKGLGWENIWKHRNS
jgi:hypothetical protein